MKLETFFEKFEQFADAQDAVSKMRELVLRLAFSGGLTGKRPVDDGVPAGWERRTVDSISASISSGFACSRSHQMENGHVHLRTHNISTLGTLNFDLLIRIDPNMVDPQKASIRAGDILFNNTNSQELVGKTSLVDRDYDYGFSNHITRIRLKDGIFPGFVVFYLTLLRNSGYFARLCTRWINQAAINTDTLKEQTIPIPSLAEQKRIVAKVDELMALCDRLEAQQQERETRHAALSRAALSRFAEAPTPANLNFIFHKSYDTTPADLRKTILTLAVRGKLMPQDPNDEPIEHVLSGLPTQPKPLRFDKRSLTNIQGVAALSVGPTERTVPVGWSCVPLVRIARLESGHTPSRNRPDWWGGDVPWVGVVDARLHDGRIILQTRQHTNEAGLENSAARLLPSGTVCVSRTASVGYVVILGKPMATSQDFVNWVPTNAVTSDWLRLVFTAEKDGFNRFSKGAVHQTIYYPEWLSMHTLLPPVAEQRRIVAKVDELMVMCDQLEQQLQAREAMGAKLFDAVLHAILTATGNAAAQPQECAGTAEFPAAVACYAVSRRHQTLGRVQLAKCLYLAEAHVGLALNGRYTREAAGPLDGRMLASVEDEAQQQGWFVKEARTSGDAYRYRRGPNLEPQVERAKTILGERRAVLDALLKHMADWNTSRAEAVATLFAAWNDLKIAGKNPTDPEIINEVLENWHPAKKVKFTRQDLQAQLHAMRSIGLVPKGTGPATKDLSQPLLKDLS